MEGSAWLTVSGTEEPVAGNLHVRICWGLGGQPPWSTWQGTDIGLHRLDLIIDGAVVGEIKAVKDIEDLHLATVLSYLKATGLEAGLILNFAASKLRIRRVVRTLDWTAEARRSESAEKNI